MIPTARTLKIILSMLKTAKKLGQILLQTNQNVRKMILKL